MINIAICDDEKYILDKIKKLVFDFFHRKNVEITVSQFGSGEELLRHNKNIDILFLDIQMDGIDGMETARKMRSQNYKGYSRQRTLSTAWSMGQRSLRMMREI